MIVPLKFMNIPLKLNIIPLKLISIPLQMLYFLHISIRSTFTGFSTMGWQPYHSTRYRSIYNVKMIQRYHIYIYMYSINNIRSHWYTI
jgi:hypothetical protein